MTIALPVTTPEEVATDDDRHYTPWRPNPRPATPIVVGEDGEAIVEDPGIVPEAPQHYTPWQPKPRPAVVIPDVPSPVASDPGTVDTHEHYTSWTPKPR
jgi:hypothetical protein